MALIEICPSYYTEPWQVARFHIGRTEGGGLMEGVCVLEKKDEKRSVHPEMCFFSL